MSRIRRSPWAIVAIFSLSVHAAEAQQGFTIAEVSFLAGCWSGQNGPVELREQWTDASGGVLLGVTRFLRDGAIVDWEFARLVHDSGGVTLWPYPSGAISAHGFPLVRAGPQLVFENLEHDFPVRIIYTRQPGESLRIRVEGADGGGREWSVRRATCPVGP